MFKLLSYVVEGRDDSYRGSLVTILPVFPVKVPYKLLQTNGKSGTVVKGVEKIGTSLQQCFYGSWDVKGPRKDKGSHTSHLSGDRLTIETINGRHSRTLSIN